MSFLLMIFLLLVCMFLEAYQPFWSMTLQESVLYTSLAVAFVALHAFWVSRRVTWPLRRDPSRRDQLLLRYDRWRFFHQIVLYGTYVIALTCLGWGWAAPRLWPWPGMELLLLGPFILAQLLSFALFYDVERVAHRATHFILETDAFSQAWLEAQKETTTAIGGRWGYTAFQLRQKLALVFLPILLLMFKSALIRLFPESVAEYSDYIAMAGLSVVFVCMPLLIRLVLGLKPLPRGVLRDRLMAATKRLGFRCTDILLWNTRSGMANAMVIGLVPWLRYVVFTDKIIEEFPEEEVEAVFGHEVGHIRHQHMLYYLVFLLGSVVVLVTGMYYYLLPFLQEIGDALVTAYPSLPPSIGALFGPDGTLSGVPMVLIVLAYIFLVFGCVSRQCERQADVFGCRAVSCQDAACEGHSDNLTLPAKGKGLCVTGIRTFIRALDKVALVNGIDREHPGFFQSWQHSTIAKRVRFLRGMITDPDVEPTFQKRLWLLKAGLLMGIGALLAAMGMVHGRMW